MKSRTACPACNNSDARTLVHIPCRDDFFATWPFSAALRALLEGHFYTLKQCATCTCVYQVEVLDDSELALLYEDGSTQTNERRNAIRFTDFARKGQEAIFIRLLFDAEPAPKVLDYGMGSGEWIRLVEAYGCEAWGYDVDVSAQRFAETHAIRFSTLDALPQNYFHFINSDQVFEHLAEPHTVLSSLTRALRTGGVLKLSTPGERDIAAKLKKFSPLPKRPIFLDELTSVAPLAHINLFNARSLQALGTRAGVQPWTPPIGKVLGSMSVFSPVRQIEYHIKNPFKLQRQKGTWQYFIKRA